MDLESPKFTPRNVAKYVTKTIIAAAVSTFIQNIVPHDSESKTQETAVKIGGALAGWYVSEWVEPYTDKIVDDVLATIEKKNTEHKNQIVT